MSGRVPPSSRAGKTAKRITSRKDVQRAADLYERFTGHDAEVIGKFYIPSLPKAAVAIGTVDEICYTTVRDGRLERYRHPFHKKDRPVLAVSPDGKQILFVGGSYTFTERGIVDDSDPSR